jgi:hypothetical protein
MTSDGFNPHFDIDLQKGKVGEEVVERFLHGSKHEVKADARVPETGNFYVETWQWQGVEENAYPSGINVTESDYWHWSSPTGKGGLWIETETLKEILSENDYRVGKQTITNEHTNASKGRLVPLTHILQKLGFVK